ncbi:bifunctional adenosylcobinamide kinase/adenosylcobinamide-phosphate guanylyltransferase [Nocardioides massiliensis]|uniref:Adenosylcobinamide kinase n=1 Tax=Nocardioides massiliensis TaxID=1325935 RepID=A0ABT9NU05_9ACTN|nr:bifunctional adenosylcobinamide kinase/adenosylcobinamide-phosphate guanylyltransferase [Nocardioides massiliensis]MDP9823915.1 adenosylcobinamide kinase/adenosylcobinamide-phosphate guanylyltransferase [Nocardioides massiliensis]
MRVLVTGGVRSGKSHHAEGLVADRVAVAYVAPGPAPTADDADWTARVAAHRARRPASWTTHETADLAGVLDAAPGPVLIDCLGTWVTALVDDADLWEAPTEKVEVHVHTALDRLVRALRERDDVVVVTNEVGWGVVPSHRSGRVFRDALGTVNRVVAAVCDEVHLVVAGRVLVL